MTNMKNTRLWSTLIESVFIWNDRKLSKKKLPTFVYLFIKVADVLEDIPNLISPQSVDNWRYENIGDDKKCRQSVSLVNDEAFSFDQSQINCEVHIDNDRNESRTTKHHKNIPNRRMNFSVLNFSIDRKCDVTEKLHHSVKHSNCVPKWINFRRRRFYHSDRYESPRNTGWFWIIGSS